MDIYLKVNFEVYLRISYALAMASRVARSQTLDSEAIASLAVELRILVGQLTRRLREESMPGDLSLSQVSVLGRLEREGPATVTALARGERMRPQSMGAVIASLEADGLVAGAADPADGRQTIYTNTAAARAIIKMHRAKRDDWLMNAISTRLAEAEQRALADAVSALHRLIDG
jgi:DNA-binding MarR family transcriptional regulator